MMVHPNTHPFDSDLVITDDNDRVIDLDPKNPDRNYYYNNKVNAGMYVMEKGICDYIKAGQIKQDLEKDIVLPLTKTKFISSMLANPLATEGWLVTTMAK